MELNHGTDCILIAEGKPVFAHKLILAIASPFFLELFKANPEFTVFVIPGLTLYELRLLLRYIYTGGADVHVSHADRFIAILKYFGVQHQESILQDDPMDGSFGRRSSKLNFPRSESPKLKRKSCGHHRSGCKARRKLVF